jgi:hypothetical protein
MPEGRQGPIKDFRGSRFEVSTNTRDPNLQTVFSDPYGTLVQLGLSIPSPVPTYYTSGSFNTPWANRYLALLVSVKFAEGESARLVGMRQRVLIGEYISNGEGNLKYNYPVYTPVVTPEWHFQDGNISWHLRKVPLSRIPTANAGNAAELSYRDSDTPCILFENPPADAGGYAPPYGGYPPGDVVIPEFGNFHDIRFPWQQNGQAWESLDIEIQGPCAINLYASIQQTNPDSRVTLPLGDIPLSVLVPEEQFIQNFTNAVYTRIAGSLIFERANLYAEAKQLNPCDNPAYSSALIRPPRKLRSA